MEINVSFFGLRERDYLLLMCTAKLVQLVLSSEYNGKQFRRHTTYIGVNWKFKHPQSAKATHPYDTSLSCRRELGEASQNNIDGLTTMP